MALKISLILAHPNPASFNHAMAQAALQTLRTEHWNDMKTFYDRVNADAPLMIGIVAERQRWVGDTTEFLIGSSAKLYLAAIMDLHSRFIVGWALSAVNDRHLTLSAPCGVRASLQCCVGGTVGRSASPCMPPIGALLY